MAKQILVLAVRRHREFLAPHQDDVLLGTTFGRSRNYSGGYVELKPLGVVNLPIPWDSRTLIGVAIGAAAHGLADNFLGQSVGEVLAPPGDAIGRAVMEGKAVIPERVRKSLRRKSAFVIPFLRVIEVAYTVGLMAQPTLHVCEEDESGRRIEHDVQMESDKPPVRDIATEVAVGRARAEGIAAVKMAAAELLRQLGTPADEIRLDPIRPFSAAEIQYLNESGLTSMEVAKLAETRYGAIGHEFKMCPDAELAFFAFFDPF